MNEMRCRRCGAILNPGETRCRMCGEDNMIQQPNSNYNSNYSPNYNPNMQQPMYNPMYNSAIDPSWPAKSRIAAGVLALLLGGIGVHKFYLGKIGLGILYLLFSWTFIPGVIALIEGIIYLCSSDETFCIKNHVRIG